MSRSLMDPNYVAPTEAQLLRAGAVRGLLGVSPVGVLDALGGALGPSNRRSLTDLIMEKLGMDYTEPDQFAPGRGAQEFSQSLTEAVPGLAALTPLSAVSRAASIGGNEIGAVGRNVAAPVVKKAGQRVGTTGQYIGYPEGIDSPQKLAAWRARRRADVQNGVVGADWYKDTSQYLWDITNRNPELADRAAFGTSKLSQTTPVRDEMSYFVKGYNQNLVGDAIDTGKYPSHMVPVLQGILNDPVASLRLGLKTEPYTFNKSVAWRPEIASQRPVNDMHIMRGFEYNTLAPTTAQHAVIDKEMDRLIQWANKNKIGGKTDWDYSSIQAAPWMTAKGTAEFERAKNPIGPVDAYIKRAARTWKDFSPSYEANITSDAIPGANTGRLPEALSAPYSEQSALTDAYLKAITDPATGNDRLAAGMGALTRPVMPNVGVYEGAETPGFVSRVLVGKEKGGQGLDPSSEKLVRAVAAGHGLMNTQKQMAYNFLGLPSATSLADAGGVRFIAGAPMDQAKLRSLQQEIAGLNPSWGVDIAQADPLGARALLFAGTNKDSRAAVEGIASRHGAQAEFAPRAGDIFPRDEAYNAPEKWGAQAYINEIRAGGPKVVEGFNNAVGDQGAGLARRALNAADYVAQSRGWTDQPWYKPMMRTLAREGLDGLQRLVDQGVVPRAVLGAIGAGAVLSGRSAPEPAQ